MYSFDGWSTDELHTLCTLVGNGVKKMEIEKAEMRARGRGHTARYIERCIEDAEKLQEMAQYAFDEKSN